MHLMRPNGQWEFLDSWVHLHEGTSRKSAVLKTLSFAFRLRRKPLYVCLNLFCPMVGILLLQLTVFCLPSDAGEKISIGLTLFLAQTVFQLVLSEQVPETSDQIPIFSKFQKVQSQVDKKFQLSKNNEKYS